MARRDRGKQHREDRLAHGRWIHFSPPSGRDTAVDRAMVHDRLGRTHRLRPRGIGDDGLGVLSGYTFQEVPGSDSPRTSPSDVDSVVARFASVFARFRTMRPREGRPPRDRHPPGCFAHIGEIDALLEIRERSAQRASA